MISIKNIDGVSKCNIDINEGAKGRFSLMKEDYVILPFSLETPIIFKIGDYIDLSNVLDESLGGILAKVYEITDIQTPSYNKETGGYDYSLRFDAYYWKWKNKKFKYTPEDGGDEASWNLTDTLDNQMTVFLRNLKELGYTYKGKEFTFDIDNTVDPSAKLMSYDNINMIDSLTSMADNWKCEWWVTENVIHFGRCERFDPITIEIDKEASDMSRSDSRGTYATRIFAFGSERNIPYSYGKELIFDVTNVDSENRISDAARPLKLSYFPENSIIAASDSKFTLTASTSNVNQGGNYVVVKTSEINLAAGTYSLNTVGFYDGTYIRFTNPLYNQYIQGCGVEYTLAAKYSGGVIGTIIQNSYYIQSFQFQNAVKFLSYVRNKEIKLDSDVQGFYLELSMHFVFQGNVYPSVYWGFSGKAIMSIPNRYSSANVYVEFISGALAGKVSTGILNPDNTKESENVIKLNSQQQVSVGDRFKIKNIIIGNVPAYFFTAQTNGLVVNGVVQKRLMLPDGVKYIDAYRYLNDGTQVFIGEDGYDTATEMPQEEAIEDIIVYDEIYPRLVDSISQTWTEITKSDITDENSGDTSQDDITRYFFKVDSFVFKEDYLLEGVDLNVVFQSGNLRGMRFDVKFNPKNEPEVDSDGNINADAQVYQIIPNENYGRELPDELLCPNMGDEYIFDGWDSTKLPDLGLVEKAEDELFEHAVSDLKKSMVDDGVYNTTLASDWVYNDRIKRTFEIGQRIELINRAFFASSRRSRVVGFELNLDIPYDSPMYEIGESLEYSRLGEIEERIENITYRGVIQKGTTTPNSNNKAYIIGVNDSTPISDTNVYSAKRSEIEFLSRLDNDTARGLINFIKGIVIGNYKSGERGGILDGNGYAELNELLVRTVARLMRTISDEISSESFTDGLLGEGFKLWMNDEGLAELTVDKLTVRQLMTVFEMLIQKVYSVGGELIVSAANGKIKTVEKVVHEASAMDCYYITFENDNEFQEWDLVRCQIFNSNGMGRGYWVSVYGVESADGGGIYLPISGFNAGVYPEVGDELVLMGNAHNTARQNLISISATEDGKPRIDILSGVNTTSLAGCLRVRLGDLSGIIDSTLGDLSGQGLFADNCYLKGTFHFRNGKNAEDAISEAQKQADQAKTDAETANNKLADIADDNKLTAGEQPEVLREWLEIKAEYYGYISQANNYGISTSSIETVYDSLSGYIGSLFPEEVPTETTLDIDGEEFRRMFADYYQARQDLLDAIATDVKIDSDKALEQLSKIADDGWLTQGEQPEVLREIEAIKSEYSGYKSQVQGIYSEITTTFDTYEDAYTQLISYVTTLFGGELVQSSSDIEIDATEFNGKFKDYYDARKDWLQAMSAEQKRLSESYTDTQFKVLEGNITASVTEVRTELGEVKEELQSQITQNAESITASVTKTEYNDKVNAIETSISQIEQTADRISLTVDGITMAVDGSYNLLNEGYTGLLPVIDSYMSVYIRNSVLSEIKGKTLCYSVYVTGENVQAGMLGVQARIGYEDGTTAYPSATISNRGNFEDVRIEFSFTTDETKNVTSLWIYPLFRNGTISGNLYFSKPQLEIGTLSEWRMPISDKTSRNLLANTSATGVISPIGYGNQVETVDDHGIKAGDWLTASAYLELKDAKASQIGIEVNILYTDGTSGYINNVHQVIESATVTEFKCITIQVNKAVEKITMRTLFRQGTSGTIAPSGEVFTSKQKLEIGKVASRWISATEDVTSGLTQQLLATGIDITKEEIVVTAPKFLVQGNDGTPVAVFKTYTDHDTGEVKPMLSAPYIDVENLEVKKLNGAIGTFKKLTCAENNEGKDPAYIHFDSGYNAISFKDGNLMHDETFYLNDAYVTGSFGARKRTTLYILGINGETLTGTIYSENIYPNPTFSIPLTTMSNDTQYYAIELVNPAIIEYVYALPIDTVIFGILNTNPTQPTKIVLGMTETQRAFIYNLSSDINILTNSKNNNLSMNQAGIAIDLNHFVPDDVSNLGAGIRFIKLPTD